MIGISLAFNSIPVSGEVTEESGDYTLKFDNNWVFKVHSDNVKTDTQVVLEWTSNGTSTGWIICRDNSQVAKVINSTERGELSMESTHSSCSIVIYRVYKPLDNHTIYIGQYSYSWDLSENSDRGWLDIPTFYLVLLLITAIFQKRRHQKYIYSVYDLPNT